MAAYEIAPFPSDLIFRPTDEQLVNHYLRLKKEGHHSEIQIIPEVDFSNYDPRDLPAFSAINSDESQWFFFRRRDATCRNSSPGASGFWMTTGFRSITSSKGLIGRKWTSVFYKGFAPNGERTKWMMHEYHAIMENDSPRKDDFVLCRLTKKEGYQDGDDIIDDVNAYLRRSTAYSGDLARPVLTMKELRPRLEYFAETSGTEAIEKQTSETQGELFEIEAADVKLKSGEIIEKSGEEYEASQSCPMQSGLELKELPKDVDWEKDEKISLPDGELPKNPRSPKLLTLFLQGNKRVIKIPKSFFDYMPALETLDLSSTGISSLPDSIIKLSNLKRLSLKDCHCFMKLLPEVGELNRLEVLDLEGTDIIELPEEIKKLTNLKWLKVSIYSFQDDGGSDMESNVGVHCNVILELSRLNQLSIRVNPDDEWWIERVEPIVSEVCSLKSLDSLEFYFSSVELVSQFLLKGKFPSLLHFKFTVGCHVRRILPRLPCDVESELERQARCLKFINGEDLPKDIKRVLQYSTAFFLERHATVKKLSEFGIRNMEHLKCCVVGECNEVEVIIDEADTRKEDREVVTPEEDESTHGPKKIVFESLEYLYIYYTKNLMSMWKGPVQPKCLSLLKTLGLRTCPQLTTIFTEGLLRNLVNLEELTVEDCPSVTSLVSHETSGDHKTPYLLPNLKSILLHYMPGLVTICSGSLITPKLEWVSFYNCPNLKSSCVEEEFTILSGSLITLKWEWMSFNKHLDVKSLWMEKESRNALKEIKCEKSWWEALERRHDRPSYLDGIFVPIKG